MAKLRAKRSIQAPGRLSVREGELVDEDHPIVRGREEFFEPAPAKKKAAKKKAAG